MKHRRPTSLTPAVLAGQRARCLILAAALALSGCSGAASAASDVASSASDAVKGALSQESTSGASFSPAQSLPYTADFDEAAATGDNDALIDVSHAAQGYVAAAATNASRLKLQVSLGDSSYNIDMATDGTPTVAPLTLGSGSYLVRVMQNTTGNSYVELTRAEVDAQLESEFAPYLRPNAYCNYGPDSTCVIQARELVADAQNQGDALAAICNWICDNITYDDDKASQLKDSSGYVPDPDQTIADGKGICFDYASLGAAMLRSQGIPTQLVTGSVSPDNISHAWIMVYIDGTWTSAAFDVEQNTWSRVDLTFAASGGGTNVGDGKTYTAKRVY